MQNRRGKLGRQTILGNQVFHKEHVANTAYSSYDDLLSGMDGHINHQYVGSNRQQAGPCNSYDQLVRNPGNLHALDAFTNGSQASLQTILQTTSHTSESQPSSLEFNFDTPSVSSYTNVVPLPTYQNSNGNANDEFRFDTNIPLAAETNSYISNDIQTVPQLQNVEPGQLLEYSTPSLYPYMTDGDDFPFHAHQDNAHNNNSNSNNNTLPGNGNALRLMEASKPVEAVTPSKRLPFLDSDSSIHISPTAQRHGTWRRPSKSRLMLSVKRSQSTPNVQLAAAAAAAAGSDAAADEALAMALLDKKKNKLGYHRTSIACGHCRRRKIRCLLAKDDTRCSNCIRLKKDCNFFPVETTERRPRSASKPENNIDGEIHDTPSSNSSPSRSPQLSLSLSKLPRHSISDVYPASQPITPNNEYPSCFDDGMRHRSISSAGRLSIAHSTAVSRRPSLAHMYTAPLPSREFRSSSESSPNYSMMSASSFADRFGERLATGLVSDEPLSTVWRTPTSLTSGGFVTLPQQVNFGMPPLNEHPMRHSRFNSVDNGVDPISQFMFGLGDATNTYTSSHITSSPIPDSAHALQKVNITDDPWHASSSSTMMTKMINSLDRQEQPDDSWFIKEEIEGPKFTNDHTHTLLQSPLGMSGMGR